MKEPERFVATIWCPRCPPWSYCLLKYKLHAALFSSDRLVVSLSWEDVYAEKARTAGRRRLAFFTGHCPVCRTFSRRAKTIRVLGSDPARNIFSPEAFTPCTRASLDMWIRQKRIIEGICQGLSNNEIARRLPLSPHTVKSHINTIFKKLNINEPVKADGVCYASSARSFCLNPRRSFFSW